MDEEKAELLRLRLKPILEEYGIESALILAAAKNGFLSIQYECDAHQALHMVILQQIGLQKAIIKDAIISEGREMMEQVATAIASKQMPSESKH